MIKRFSVLFAALAAAVLMFGAAGTANADAATKVGLLANAVGGCSTGAAGGVETGGFAIINTTGSGKLIAVLSLKGLTPNHTYNVALVQTPSGTDCFTTEATVTADGAGNGTVNIREDLRAGTTGAFVLVQPSDPNGFIASSPLVAVS